MIECIVELCEAEIHTLLDARDRALFGRRAPGILQDESLEVLSELPIDIDGNLAGLHAVVGPALG